MRRIAIILLAALAGPVPAFAQSCPEPLASARRLVLVTGEMSSKDASVQRFERAAPADPWRAIDAASPALIGHNGMGWAQAFRSLARRGEPVKAEGDKRAPAGIYRLGRSFGFAASTRPDYLRVTDGMVCVDDVKSPAYNTITTRPAIGPKIHAENMRHVPAYRNGLLVDYPSDARTRAGSCIFIHVRLPDAKGTSGCVALPEAVVVALQDFAEPGAVLAVLPKEARERLPGCLP